MVPKHIGIIMDGNRRFARRVMAKPWKGHEWGTKKLEQVLEWCQEHKIKELTVYTFSIQNFSRPKKEFDYIMKLFLEGFNRLKDDKRLYENKIRINVIGRLSMFPKNHGEYIINFAMGYGGQEEVVDAARKIAEGIKKGKIDVKDINEATFKDYLYMKDEPELIIRTGGEQRTSNFLAYQGVYSEYIFIEKMWPEFEKEDFMMCLKEYSKRKRRFGN
jgi:tritrans,polycis-undecaprenyl-diphosphate synthase [geranylgeranyl-diphosphate specific]